ncbi:MAG: hypothetical protein KDB29_02210 [Planctomycetes bacterium]|nr:hypothetical protein [Planctomycetota bacterium]
MIRFVTRSSGVSPAPGAGNLPAAPWAGRPRPVQAGSLRYVLPLLLLLGACSQPQANNATDNQVDEHRDHWRPREAQSDFLDLGNDQSWLSFYPQDQLDYPEYFEGLNRDQKSRLRLAPKDSDERVLIRFSPPEGSKLWPVDWYGKELMAIDLPNDELNQYSVAIANENDSGGPRHGTELGPANAYVLGIAKRRAQREESSEEPVLFKNPNGDDNNSGAMFVEGRDWTYGYAAKRLLGRTGTWLVVVEVRSKAAAKGVAPAKAPKPLFDILKGISIEREIGLEGSPKHKCTSALDEQLAGTLRFADGTLRLPISEGQLVRKIGGDSTIQIDGEGAEPWILIRRLKESEIEGDLRARLRRDTTFNRRLKVPSGKFSEGYVPEGAALPIVCFDYDDSAAENNLLGILKAGNELLTFEVVTRGVVDGDKRRAAKAAALKLLANATAEPATEAPEFEPLVGWNAGTMGTGE